MITTPGPYQLASGEYHADPCPEPSLSSSIAQLLLDRSPYHAWWAHPKLNPAWQPEPLSRRVNLGSVAHRLLLGRGGEYAIIQASDYRTKLAQVAREEAQMAGQVPILLGDFALARAIAGAAHRHLSDIHDGNLLVGGHTEETIAWNEGGIWCRALIDWHNGPLIVDYKTTSGSAHPDGLGQKIFQMGYEVQAAFYERAVCALEPELAGRVQVILVFQEIDPPYLLSAVSLDEETMTVGRQKVQLAIDTWCECLRTNVWPGYPAEIRPVMYPPWALREWMDRIAMIEASE